MTHPPPALAPQTPLLDALRRVGAGAPLGRKLLVAPSVNWGREALRQLARRDGGWVGWEVTTLRGLADEFAFLALSEAGTRAGSDIEIGALVGESLDLSNEAGELSPRARDLATSPGFRRAMQDAVLELRVAGVEAEALRAITTPGDPARDLAVVLHRYARALREASFTDAAGVFAAALDAFDEEAPFQLGGVVVLAPDLTRRGLSGRLLQRLADRGAVELPPSDRPDDAPAAACDCFVAATPADEVREVLRRVVAEGLRWDEVELVATERDSYGVALDGLCRHLGVAVTLLDGLPLARSRTGRALDRWFAWLEDGLPADLFRQMLESGDLRVPGLETDGATLAQAFRGLRIGWGRRRYEAAIEQLGSASWVRARPHDPGEAPTEEPADRERRRQRIGADLATVLSTVLAMTPPVVERGGPLDVLVEAAELASATLKFLALLPDEGQSTSRLRVRLGQIAAVPGPDHRFGAALAGLREALTDFRVWSAESGSAQPWSSRGGALHLTDVSHAGLTGRPRVFVLGLDADRASGPRAPDPLLPDRLREALGRDQIATSATRREEYRELLTRTLRGLRGRVTLSWSAASDLAGHETGPAPVLLALARRVLDAPTLSYRELRQRLGPPACAVPAGPALVLDGRDVWLEALADDGRLRDGTAPVLAGWPGLAAGVEAFAALTRPELVPHTGLVTAAAGRHDPTRSDRGISPSALERLAGCPLSWFYRYALRLAPSDDPAYDPTRWLDPAARGAVLHAIFEDFVRRYLGRQAEIAGEAARADLRGIIDARLRELAALVPPPSETVRLAEAREISAAALSFLAMEREALHPRAAGTWREIELRIDPRRVRYPLPDGSAFPLQGKIDRVDELADRQLVVIDYKTGSPGFYQEDPRQGRFRGGRHLQPALYAFAAAAMRGTPVARFEYRFPTRQGQNDRAVYPSDLLERAPALVQELVQLVRTGEFVPTTDQADCRFCDYQRSCRVEVEERSTHDAVRSPRAEWAARHGAALPPIAAMLARRGDA